MRRILFALIALGVLASLAAPVSASQNRSSHGGNSWSQRQGGHDHDRNQGRNAGPRFSRWQNGYGSQGRYDQGRHNHGGQRHGGYGSYFGIRF